MQPERIIKTILEWAQAQPTIKAVGVVGSYARGTARADSDIDLVLLTTDPEAFRADAAWLDAIDWSDIGARPSKRQDEDYGLLWSRRVWLEQDGGEIEFGFAPLSWANVNPTDPGTWGVVIDGCRVVHDPDGLLARLCAVVADGADARPCCEIQPNVQRGR
jgi:hypothetical protein